MIVWPLSRSEAENVPLDFMKLSFAVVSVRLTALMALKTGVSFAPEMLAVRVCEAVPLPSVTDR